MDPVAELIRRAEARRQQVSALLDPRRRARLGQYFTPAATADLIAAMAHLPKQGTLRILDPGSGIGSLAVALVARVMREAPQLALEVVAVEAEPIVIPHLQESLADCEAVARASGMSITTRVVADDLVGSMTGIGRLSGPLASLFDIVIMNPPYRKLGIGSFERLALASDGVDCSNLYCTFLALGVIGLTSQGQIIAITPRSFANGPYFAAFRRFFLSQMTINQVHVFESRSIVFADSDVLQENIILSAAKNTAPGPVIISISNSHLDNPKSHTVKYADILKPGDPGQFIHIPVDNDDRRIAEVFADLPCKLDELGLQVSTGRVVDFRAREYLLENPSQLSAALIYPANLKDGRIRWPLSIRKPQGLVACPQTEKLLLPAECYVIVKRFSSKEERRRIVAAVCSPADIAAAHIGFENHLNVFHQENRGLGQHIANGLALWLNSTAVDTFFRIFSGHTQVNATDLRAMRYPSQQQLTALGEALGHGEWPDQEKIDSLINSYIIT